jgi:flagellar motor component MotA
MKSAYERAMERHGGDAIEKLNDAQRAEIAEIESKSKAKIAETELGFKDKIRAATDSAARETLRAQMADELRSVRERADRAKDVVRKAK